MNCPYCNIEHRFYDGIFKHVYQDHQEVIERKVMLDISIVNQEVMNQ